MHKWMKKLTAGLLCGALGMTTIPSDTNFLFTKSDAVSGKALYEGLRQRGILIRHFDTPRLRDYIRVTIGDEEQMKAFIAAMKEILEVAP